MGASSHYSGSEGVQDEQRLCRVLAWLLRNEQVSPEAIERAISSALDMRAGEVVSLADEGAPLRRAFVNEQVYRLKA